MQKLAIVSERVGGGKCRRGPIEYVIPSQFLWMCYSISRTEGKTQDSPTMGRAKERAIFKLREDLLLHDITNPY